MNNLMISGNSTTNENWDINSILDQEKPTYKLKDVYQEMIYEYKQYSKSRKDFYNDFQLNERIKNYQK